MSEIRDFQQPPVWVLRYPTGEFVALDDASGGYPYKATSVAVARFWADKERVQRYMHTMRKEEFTLHSLEFLVSDDV